MPKGVYARIKVPPMDRFMEKVEKAESSCWIWTGAVTGGGYGNFWSGTRYVAAHRWLYEQLVGAVPDSLDLDHLCRVRHCVNPEHLEPVSRKENLLRGTHYQSSKTHCKRGHPYDEKNTRVYIYPSGRVGRFCRTCDRER